MAGITKRYVTNPNTGRKILYNGNTYKSLYTINPKTKRPILINGNTYRKLYPAVDPFLNEASNELKRLMIRDDIEALQKEAREVKTRTKKNIEDSNNVVIDALLKNKDYQAILNYVVKGTFTLTEKQATKLYNDVRERGKHTLKIEKSNETQYIAFTSSSKRFIIDILIKGCIEYTEPTGWGSDAIAGVDLADIKNLELIKYQKPKKIFDNRDGKFLPYINTTKLNLSRYQIYNQNEAYDNNINKREHCLIYALELAGVKTTLLNQIKLSYICTDETDNKINCNIRKKDLYKISTKIKSNIILCTLNKKNEIVKQIYKSKEKTDKKIEIALYANHYFIFENSTYSKYFIKHYEYLKDVSNNENITKCDIKNGKKYYYRTEGNKTNSLNLVSKLFNDGYFKKLDMIKFDETATNDILNDHVYLDNIENEQEPTEEKDEEERTKNYFYADCESFVNGDYHKLYMIGICDNYGDAVEIFTTRDKAYTEKAKEKIIEDIINYGFTNHNKKELSKMTMNELIKIYEDQTTEQHITTEQLITYELLNTITRNGTQNGLCYFHNLKYDYHLLEKYINVVSKCEKDNQLYNIIISYKGRTVELRDSYKIIPFALSKFHKEFNLSKEYSKKEAIAYTFYTEETHNKQVLISDYEKLLSKKEQDIFNENVINEPSYNKQAGTFNATEYYKEYLRLDCLVLKKGIQKFDELIKQITKNKMSVYESLTISSLTDTYMIKEGAYTDIYKMKGNLRAYVAKAVFGGRVCVNSKYTKKVIEGKISDYDGVSLYPSAINRLCREVGLPKGKAKRLLKEQFDKWGNMTYCILSVKINKVNKIQQMPFITHKNKDVSINYLNEAPPEVVVIDSITLKDYINFHHIEYEIIDGVYWNEGGNKKMGEIVKTLFDERTKYKKTNKALANIIKLMLNSTYGKTITKKTTTEKIIILESIKRKDKISNTWNVEQRTNLNDYVYNNFNTIKSFRKLNATSWEIERTKADDSYNRGHVGCMILSMSKRIMNEVFDVANTHALPIYYTDTDSIHCNLSDVPTLEKEYFKTYNKILNGVNLEQFHTDFELLDENGAPRQGAGQEIYATKSIFLGKKSYIDVLESKDKDGNIINGYHIRLKGITEEGLLKASKEYKNDYLGLYTDLAKGTKKRIVLNPFNPDENKQKVLFEFKAGRVSTRKEFIREVAF